MMKRNILIATALPVLTIALFLGAKHFVFPPKLTISNVLHEHGYSEIKPPSLLLPPGTWVQVLSKSPLHLDIICVAENALDAESIKQVQNSASIYVEAVSQLSQRHSLDIEALKRISSNNEMNNLERVSFKLSDVRIIDLPDEAVISGIKNRSDICDEAIKFRIDGNQDVTMIKSVVIADAIYELSFKKGISSEQKSKLTKEVAIELDLKLAESQEGKSVVIGKNLIWGIRDDERLALFGMQLPSTGNIGPPFKGKGILLSDEPVAKISISEPLRRELEHPDVKYDVTPLRQNSAMSCWATVYAMMASWKSGEQLSVSQAVSLLGNEWLDLYLFDQGLPAGQERKFVSTTGMASEPPASYSLEAYVQLLKDNGPLWIITGDGISSHAKLLIGIYGHETSETITEYEETTFEFIDPATGSYEYISALDFSHNFEEEARWLVDRNRDLEFRDQILFWNQ